MPTPVNRRMEEEARRRRERLAALREGKGIADIEKAEQKATAERTLAEERGQEVESTLDPLELSVEKQVQELIEEAKSLLAGREEGLKEASEITLEELAPQKPHADLKRDLEGKSVKLERRTEKAIAELIRRRLEAESTS